MSKKVTFENENGDQIAARLDLPPDSPPKATALFAHCFTCSKNLHAVRRVSKALNEMGIAVLRIDFTGLGESEGDFEESGLTQNISDLVKASEHLKTMNLNTTVIIGHSFGGAAAILAAGQMEHIRAVVTIAAPSDPEHVKNLFKEDLETIRKEGKANVEIAGRAFTISSEFVEDIEATRMRRTLNELNKPLLIFHSPVDQVVGVDNAAEIYKAARHPKSYISLDDADHLLTKEEDATYVGAVIGSWLTRYLNINTMDPVVDHIPDKGVTAHLGENGFTTTIHNGRHRLLADEPESIGGEDLGPSPYEFLSAGLGACTAMTLQMYARRKKWDLKEVIVEVDHFKGHADDCSDCEDGQSKIDHLHKTIKLIGELDDDQKKRLLEIAEKCPVNKTLKGVKHIQSTLKE